MGTRLSAGGREVWLDLGELAGGGLGELGLDAAVGAGGLLERAYGDLVDHLSGSHQVRPFPYDWRLSLRHAADELAGELERILATTNQPVRLLAHSMGGLVARALQARHADVWRRVVQRSGSRLIMLGTPNAGSFAIPRMLLGRDRLIRMLALLDFDHSLSEILSLVATYPGVLELLPRHASSDFDAFDEAAWAPLREANDDRWTVPSGDALTAARRFRDELDACEIDTEHTLYVAGQDRSTPMAVEVRGRRVLFHATGEGDGRVPWRPAASRASAPGTCRWITAA
jgi:pimeloyl-ACP methyl ester carboxylesterase